jgi:hypothetical protein
MFGFSGLDVRKRIFKVVAGMGRVGVGGVGFCCQADSCCQLGFVVRRYSLSC